MEMRLVSYFQHSVVPSIHVHIHRGHSPAYWYSFHVPNRRCYPYSTGCLQQNNINSTMRWGIYLSFLNSVVKYYSKEFRIVIHRLLNEGKSKFIFILWLQKVLSVTDFSGLRSLPTAQVGPFHPSTHLQSKPPGVLTHVAPCWQGKFTHSSVSTRDFQFMHCYHINMFSKS